MSGFNVPDLYGEQIIEALRVPALFGHDPRHLPAPLLPIPDTWEGKTAAIRALCEDASGDYYLGGLAEDILRILGEPQ